MPFITSSLPSRSRRRRRNARNSLSFFSFSSCIVFLCTLLAAVAVRAVTRGSTQAARDEGRAGDTEGWKKRTVYQVITDRFARSTDHAEGAWNKQQGKEGGCTDLSKYCGGTWKGIQNNLDYIQVRETKTPEEEIFTCSGINRRVLQVLYFISLLRDVFL